MKTYLTLLYCLLGIWSYSQNYQDSLDIKLQALADLEGVPGFAVSIMRDGEIKYLNGFGWADIQAKKKYKPQMIQNIGSISKTVIGVALMKAEAMGVLDLDDPINKYLPFPISNPRFPNEAITIRHLASHTGSLNDPDEYEKAYIFQEKINIDPKSVHKYYRKYIPIYNANKRTELSSFVKSIYHPSGKYYKKKNFLKVGPGKEFSYSNIGAGIAAWVIEIASGETFVEFTQKHIFDPIGMQNTSWELNKIDLNKKVTPYISTAQPIPHYDLITFADGGLITSVKDLSKYIMEMMRCYEGKGSILTKEQCIEMMTPYLKNNEEPYGIFWSKTKSGKSIGHNGGDPGTATNMYFQPATGVAKIMFINMIPIDDKSGSVANNAWNTLKEYELLVD